MDVWFFLAKEPLPRGIKGELKTLKDRTTRSSRSASGELFALLTRTYHGSRLHVMWESDSQLTIIPVSRVLAKLR